MVLGFTVDHHNSSPPSQQEIQQAYRRKSLELHPDKNKAPDATAQFMKLGQAYETLSDPIQRRHYDHELLLSRQRPNYKQQNQWHYTHQRQRRQYYDPWDEIRKEFTKFQQKQPRTTDVKNSYTYEDALHTFRSCWGLAETTLGKTQIAAMMYRNTAPFLGGGTMTTTGRTTPSLFATTAAYVITTLKKHNSNSRSNNKHDTRHQHYYYHHPYQRERDELRRTIDTTLQVLVPMFLGTLGTDRTAKLVGRTSLVFGVVAVTLFLVQQGGYVHTTVLSRPLKLRGVSVTILGIGLYGALVVLFKQQQHHVKHNNTNTNRHRRDTKEEDEEEDEEEEEEEEQEEAEA